MLALRNIVSGGVLTFGKNEMWKVEDYYHVCGIVKKDELWLNQAIMLSAQ